MTQTAQTVFTLLIGILFLGIAFIVVRKLVRYAIELWNDVTLQLEAEENDKPYLDKSTGDFLTSAEAVKLIYMAKLQNMPHEIVKLENHPPTEHITRPKKKIWEGWKYSEFE